MLYLFILLAEFDFEEIIMKNKVKQKLKQGKAVMGAMVTVNDPLTLHVMANSGFDYLLVDTQHSVIGTDTLFSIIKGLNPTEAEVIVRVIWNDRALINQALDFGADGVIVPFTNTADEVEQAIIAAKYPPRGIRSWGPRYTDRYGKTPDEYWENANEQTLVFPQIESVQAVENLDTILQVDGVDGIMIGPNDLAMSFGMTPGLGKKETEPIFQQVLDKCKEHNVPWGMFTVTLEIAEQWFKKGGQIDVVGGDFGWVLEGAQNTLKEVNSLLSNING
jgi:2-keto-3-deoxy-L-rhamnonate aldolase RhmA